MILNRLLGRVLQREGTKESRHAEFISASQIMSLRSAEGTFPPDIGKILKMPLGRIRRRLKQSSLCINRSRNTCAMTNLSLRSGFGNIFILPLFLRNLNPTPSLALPIGEGKYTLRKKSCII